MVTSSARGAWSEGRAGNVSEADEMSLGCCSGNKKKRDTYMVGSDPPNFPNFKDVQFI